MAGARFNLVLEHARRLATRFEASTPSDRQLVDAFVQTRDEASFTALVHRHGPMDLGVCRRLLRDSADAEDAFQITFFVLARKAASIRKLESTSSWLHGVALRAAHKCRLEQARRKRRERDCARPELVDASDSMTWGELRGLLDEEMGKMDARFRAPLILCFLEGRTQDEAASQLGWSKSTLRRRLERGRALMRVRLARRGITLSAGLATAWLSESASPASVPMVLATSTVRDATAFGMGHALQVGTSSPIIALTNGVLQALLLSNLARTAALVLVSSLMIFGGGFVAYSAIGADRLSKSQLGLENGSTSLVRTQPAAKDSQKAMPPTVAQKKPVGQLAILSGRIVDETGAPVTDAVIDLINTVNYQSVGSAKTDENGKYQLKNLQLKQAGNYSLGIVSQRWVGLAMPDPLAHVYLEPDSNADLDLELKRACRLRVHVVNEEGQPVQNVQVRTAFWSDDPMYSGVGTFTDKEGLAALGVKPSPEKRFVATIANDYGFASIDLMLNDPEVITEQKIVLRKGKEVKGFALCSDGKPAAGWRITAMPTWWHLGSYPMGSVIGKDGSFTLPHLVSDRYNLTVSIPIGPNMNKPVPVLSDVVLPVANKLLAVTVDHPSPGSLTPITGRIQLGGASLQLGIRITAKRTDRGFQDRGADYLEPGKVDFQLGPLPKGSYSIEFASAEIEPFKLENVAVPCEKLDVKLKLRGR